MYATSKITLTNTCVLSRPREKHPYENAGDARQNIWIKPLRETNQGVTRALFHP